jgi:hypothetical protein
VSDDDELSPTLSIGIAVVGIVATIVFVLWLVRPKPQSALAELTEGALEIQPAGMTGTFARFDVIGNVPFATKLAKQWKADALLVHVHALEVQRSGVIETTGSGKEYNDVEYTFVAPSDASGALRLTFHDKSIRAEILERSGALVPPSLALGCDSAKLADVVRYALNAPLYSLDLDHYAISDAGSDREWRWVAVEDGDERRVRVCAATCTLREDQCD